jgi:probable F420-dependent oxidoreductase
LSLSEQSLPGSRRFRFGVQHYPASSRSDWQEKARRAEALGYDTLLMPDHIGQGGLAWGPALMAVADVTSTLRIGTLVLANDFRHPALLASEAATVDLLSNGRLELGLGAGWDQRDYHCAGIKFDNPSVRIARLQESLQIVKALFSGSATSFEGNHYCIRELEPAPVPYLVPHPPIMIGGGGPRILSIAAREADIVSVMPEGIGGDRFPDLTDQAMLRAIERVRIAAGDRWVDLEINTLIQRFIVTDDPHSSASELSQLSGLTIDQVLASPWALIGTIEEIVEKMNDRRERFGLSYYVVPGWHMDAFAPVVARLKGT